MIELKEYDLIEKSEFDRLAREKQFSDGPFRESFGDGYGEPYNPNRTLHGTLKNGRKVKAIQQ